ncbi:hypothetical protein RchiOBHm_Chr5g0080601 [Rosa chinensis]|uniref:Aspartic peptidase domain-containing protein n=1 Tax=Rosa chinensis TaxID=74649 RepID=A0A2P6QMU0_ROSCH|nr:hypothetical protein RchiOBHm_Chr5g0080601 [Rosa chinensis]
MMIEGFYGGLLPHERRRVDVAAQGSLHSHGQTEAWDILEHLGRQSRQWDDHDSRRERVRKDPYYDTKSTHETRVAQESSSADYRKLERKLDLLLQAQERGSSTHHVKAASMSSSLCLLCDSPIHATSECHLAPNYPDFVQEQVKAVNSYGGHPRNDPYSPTYNPGWRNHPNFSWRDQGGSSSGFQGGKQSFRGGQGQDSSNFAHYGNAHQGNTQFSQYGQHGQQAYGPSSQCQSTSSQGFHAQNAPPGFTQGGGYGPNKFQGVPIASQPEEKKSASDDALSSMSQCITILSQGQATMQKQMGLLEVQLSQMAKELSTRQQGALPSQPEPNPRGKLHECNAVTTLRSGKVYDNHVYMPTSSSLHTDPLFDDDVGLHSYGAKREENVPFGHVVDDQLLTHHDSFYHKEDGTGREENVPSGKYGVGDVTLNIKGRNKGEDKAAGGEENVPSGGANLGKGYGFLSFENNASKYGLIDSGKERAILRKNTSRDEDVSDPKLDGEAMEARDPSKANDTSRKVLDDIRPTTHEFEPSTSREKEGRNKEEDLHMHGSSRDRSGPVYSSLGEALRAKNPSGTVTTLRGTTGSLTFDPPLDLSTPEPQLPYPNVPRKENVKKGGKKKKIGLMSEVHDILKKVNVNIPLIELLRQMPVYAKFLKDLCTHKRKIKNDERFEICEEVSAILQRRIPPKLKDPGSFNISCTIGEKVFDRALMDLGSSVNIISFETFRKLDLGPIKATPIFLQLADRSIKRAMGVVEDVLIKVDKFYLPADLVVLDMDDGPHSDKDIPIILGRPFMATAGIKINVQKGTIKMKVLGEKVLLKSLEPIYPPEIVKSMLSINLVKGNAAKSERIFGPLNLSKPTIRAQNHFSPIWGYDNEPPLKHDDVVPTSTLEPTIELEKLTTPILETYEQHEKKSPPLSEAQKESNKKLREVCGVVKKEGSKRYDWPPPSSYKLASSIARCFGNDSDASTIVVGGKKTSFEPP